MPERAAQLKFDLEMLMRADDDRYTYFMELRERGVFLHAAPIDLAEILQQRLFASHDTLVFTSATLSTNHDFTYFKQRVGLDPALQAARADEDKEGEGEGEEKKDEKGSKIKGITPDDVTEVLLDPVFDYEDQCLIYVPRRLSAPNSHSSSTASARSWNIWWGSPRAAPSSCSRAGRTCAPSTSASPTSSRTRC